ncbi:MAG: ABC transporter ATP-binding protein [Dehalococcoidia bacterium]|nr:ABC transporter ATP-binding protein [Dehalococcoidia bacterium]
MVQLSCISKVYNDVYAVKDLDLEINRREIVGIIGHNGAGKTTAIKMIVGLIAPTSGELRVMGMDIQKEGLKIKKSLGYLPEENALYENMSAMEYMGFFANIYGMSAAETKKRGASLLGSLKLDTGRKLIGEMSKGMKRKVSIARTLMHNPDLLILDEPNSGLDPLTSFFIIDYCKKLREEGKTILLSAHNLFHVEYICDSVAIIKNGKLMVYDTMDNIRRSMGKREFQIVFKADEKLDYGQKEGNYSVTTPNIEEMADLLRRISDNNWALVDLAIRQSALEDIYLDIMGDEKSI